MKPLKQGDKAMLCDAYCPRTRKRGYKTKSAATRAMKSANTRTYARTVGSRRITGVYKCTCGCGLWCVTSQGS